MFSLSIGTSLFLAAVCLGALAAAFTVSSYIEKALKIQCIILQGIITMTFAYSVQSFVLMGKGKSISEYSIF